MPPKDKDGKDNKPVVKGKGNLMKVPTKGELDKDASILAMRWIWRSSSSAGAAPQHVLPPRCVVVARMSLAAEPAYTCSYARARVAATRKMKCKRSSLASTISGRKRSSSTA
jgi:hypothetical protein